MSDAVTMSSERNAAHGLPAGARCAVHPERDALAVCVRCGNFACADCGGVLGGEHPCVSCLDRGSPLADPGRRIAAHLVDSLTFMAPLLVVWSAMIVREQTAATVIAAAGLVAWATVTVLQARRSHLYGQSYGKRLLKLRVVRADGSRISLGRIVLLRNVLPTVLSMVPIVGGVFSTVDALFMFGGARRSLHDRFADSIVVTVDTPIAAR